MNVTLADLIRLAALAPQSFESHRAFDDAWEMADAGTKDQYMRHYHDIRTGANE